MPLPIEIAIQKAIAHHIDCDRTFVFLFGSRAEKTALPASDYDIGLYGEEKIPFQKIALIKDELEDLPLTVDVDIVDFQTVSDAFKKIALQKIILWNKPKKKNLVLK